MTGVNVSEPAAAIRITLADDAILLREALAAALVASGFFVIGQAADVPGLLTLIEREQPDVAIVDVRMPPKASKLPVRSDADGRERQSSFSRSMWRHAMRSTCLERIRSGSAIS